MYVHIYLIKVIEYLIVADTTNYPSFVELEVSGIGEMDWVL
jgi:hypothetical protein